jgi:hypothetical protein
MKRSRVMRRYLVALAGLAIGLIACAAAYAGYLAPKQQRAHTLQQRVAALEAEKRALQAKLTPPDPPVGRPHRHGPGGEDEHVDEHRDAKGRAMRILGGDQTLGVKAMQLRALEELAAAAAEAGVQGFSYHDFSETAGNAEQVAVVTRHPEGGVRREQAIKRYTLHVELVAAYSALVGFLDRIETLPHVTLPREIHFSRGSDGVTRADLTLNGYFGVDK